MTENIYQAPESSLEIKSENQDFEVWNPDVAGAWSLLFTPVFGSIIVHKNWESMGNKEEADKAKKWIYISVAVALVSLIINLVGFIYIITWYFASQKKQTKYLKGLTNGNYRKKGWATPLLIGFCCWFSVVLLTIVVLTGVSAS